MFFVKQKVSVLDTVLTYFGEVIIDDFKLTLFVNNPITDSNPTIEGKHQIIAATNAINIQNFAT